MTATGSCSEMADDVLVLRREQEKDLLRVMYRSSSTVLLLNQAYTNKPVAEPLVPCTLLSRT